jgi:hypothetical protein
MQTNGLDAKQPDGNGSQSRKRVCEEFVHVDQACQAPEILIVSKKTNS